MADEVMAARGAIDVRCANAGMPAGTHRQRRLPVARERAAASSRVDADSSEVITRQSSNVRPLAVAIDQFSSVVDK
jgi:hypothetical protein